MREVILFFVMLGLVLGVLGLIVWNGKREERKSVRGSQGTPSPAPHHDPPPVMSKELPARADTDKPIPKPVSVSGSDTKDFDLGAIPSDLTYEEIVTILAGQVTPEGKPKYSGKKIYSWVGGNYNDFTALMKQLRAKDNEPAEAPLVPTPIVGRPTRATFREVES